MCEGILRSILASGCITGFQRRCSLQLGFLYLLHAVIILNNWRSLEIMQSLFLMFRDLLRSWKRLEN